LVVIVFGTDARCFVGCAGGDKGVESGVGGSEAINTSAESEGGALAEGLVAAIAALE
jgi:hypothetical protein